MFLYIRMALYFAFSWMAGLGYGEMDQAGGTFTISLDQSAQVLAGIGGFVATFIASRIAAARGGKT